MGLGMQEGWIMEGCAGLWNHACVLFGVVVAVNIKCFDDGERAVGVLVLVTLDM